MLFEKIGINYKKGHLTQLRICGKTVIQIEHIFDENNPLSKDLKITCPLFKKETNNKKVFYLKVNSKNYKTSMKCIEQWLDVANKMDADYYFICDDKDLERNILKTINFPNADIKFITSDRTILKSTLKKICSVSHLNAAYATLTAYKHSETNGIKNFWCIDADSIYIFAQTNDIVKSLTRAENIAENQDLHALTLDTERSSCLGLKWNFGVTYVRHNQDEYGNGYEAYLKSIVPKKLLEYYRIMLGLNHTKSSLSDIFSYLKATSLLKLATFNMTNIFVINWNLCNFDDISRMICTGTTDKTQHVPFYDALLFKPAGIKVADDVITIDLKFTQNYNRNYVSKILLESAHNLISTQQRVSATQMKSTITFQNMPSKESPKGLKSKIANLFKNKK